MVAQSLYSHKELHKKNQSDMQEMVFQKGLNWNDLHYSKKRGTFVVKVTTGGFGDNYPNYVTESCKDVCEECKKPLRNKWEAVETPMAFSEKDFEKWL